MGRLLTSDTAMVTISGGQLTGAFVRDSSHVTMLDGRFLNNFETNESAVVRMSGGAIEDALSIRGSSDTILSGGEVGVLSAGGNSTVTITGGSMGTFETAGFAVVRLTGGSVLNDVQALADSSLNWSGGAIGGSLFAFENSVVTITGTGFNFPLGDIAESVGTLIGTLSDGTQFNVPFGRASTATIRLVAGVAAVPAVGQVGRGLLAVLLFCAAIGKVRAQRR